MFLRTPNPWVTMIRDLMIGGASVEDTLVGFVVARCQATHPSAVYAGAGRGRGGTVSRRTVGQRAAQDGLDAGGSGRRSRPWRQQAILGRGQWDADALRDIVREYALETLGDEDAVLVIDETGFPAF